MTKNSDISEFLTKTGFILEMEVAEILKKFGYVTDVNQYFLDLEESKKREIDIVARKEVNKIRVNLIMECKQSLTDDWVFICSDKKPPRYYYAVKHSPFIYNFHKHNLFGPLHHFDKKIPLAQNYLTFDKYKKKKSNSLQIEECLHKLPKSLIFLASLAGANLKNIFFPTCLFSGQIFTARYEDGLLVEENKLIQYQTNFESKYYPKRKKLNRLLEVSPLNDFSKELYDFEDAEPEEDELREIIKKANELGSKFQIDFVTKEGLEEYLKMIDEEISKISTKKWAFNTTPFRHKRLPPLPKSPIKKS